MAPGTYADLTLLRVHEGEWEFIDGDGQINIGPYALEPVSCIRAGQVMPIDYGPREGGWLPNRKRTWNNQTILDRIRRTPAHKTGAVMHTF